MVKYFIKVGSSVSALALVAASFVGPVAAINVNLEGNGSDSNQIVNVNQSSNTSVNQTNNASIDNNFDVDLDTGDNTAEDNTGGDVSVETGDATANVSATNLANANQANVENCCVGDVNVTIKDNGTHSDNDVTLDLNNTVNVDQDNYADFDNEADIDLDTGDNDANDNTGGDVTIDTGDADATVTIDNTANLNGAVVGGGNGSGGVLSVVIEGNGSDSDSNVDVDSEAVTEVNQYNNADFDNNVNIDGDTGDNTVEDNTGGESSVTTGDATANVDVSNTANFNWADVDGCGCIFDDEESSVTVKGNGTGSDNDVTLNLLTAQLVGQDNYADFDNGSECDEIVLDTGGNNVEDNTQGGDPSIDTGDAEADVNVENTANTNALNSDSIELPDLPDGSSWAVLVWLFSNFS